MTQWLIPMSFPGDPKYQLDDVEGVTVDKGKYQTITHYILTLIEYLIIVEHLIFLGHLHGHQRCN